MSTSSPPVGWISPRPLDLPIVFIVLNNFGVDMLKAITTVATVETTVKRVRVSKSKAFMFNFSPPLLFFHSDLLYIVLETQNLYGEIF